MSTRPRTPVLHAPPDIPLEPAWHPHCLGPRATVGAPDEPRQTARPQGPCGRIAHRVDRLAPGCGRHAAALCTAGDNAVETYEFTHAARGAEQTIHPLDAVDREESGNSFSRWTPGEVRRLTWCSVRADAMSRITPLDRQVVALALPALGALVAEPVFVLVDSAVVGTLGTTPLAGLGLASTVLTTVVGLCVFLAYATTAGVARQDRRGPAGRRAAVRRGRPVAGDRPRGAARGGPRGDRTVAGPRARRPRRRARAGRDVPAVVRSGPAGHARRPGRHRGAARPAGHPHAAVGGLRRGGAQRGAVGDAGAGARDGRRRLRARHGGDAAAHGGGAGHGRGARRAARGRRRCGPACAGSAQPSPPGPRCWPGP